MRPYREFDDLVQRVRELDRARDEEDDTRLAAVRVEVACVQLVHSTEMHRRREQLRANLIVEEHLAREKRDAREGP